MGLFNMRMIALVYLMLVSVASAGQDSISSSFYTGNTLYALCQGESEADKTGCMMYVAGIYDANSWIEKKQTCTPESVTLNQIVDVAKKGLSDNPADRHLGAASLVGYYLGIAFPCLNSN